MADRRKGGHDLADPPDLILRNLPDHHGVSLIAGLLMAQNCPESADHSPPHKTTNSLQKLLFLQADPLR